MPCRSNILIAESRDFPVEAFALLQEIGKVQLADLDQSALLHAVADFDLIWVRLRNRINREILENGTRLRAVATPTTGLNHIDLGEAQRRGIEVLSLRGETDFLKNVRATAELTIGLMLALLRRLPAAVCDTRGGRWERDSFRGGELFGRTVGVVGYGRLGRLVAGYLRAFGSHVIAADPNVNAADVEPFVEFVPTRELLTRADIVTIHVSLDHTTEGFFSNSEFESMKRGALLVNTSRGELLDEVALLTALKSGNIAGAALDVLRNEQSSDDFAANPLIEYSRQHENLLITPHIGGCTVESMAKAEIFLARKVVRALSRIASEPVRDCVEAPVFTVS